MGNAMYRLEGSYVLFDDGTRVKAIAGGGPGQGRTQQTQTQTRNVAPPSTEELALQGLNTQGASQQMQQLQRAMQQQQAYESSPGYQQMIGLGTQAGQGLQGLMTNGMMPSGQQQSALQQYFQSIMAPQQAQMQQTFQNEAQRRGMTIADSPIGGDYARQLANYNAQMGGQQAGQGIQLGQNLANQYQNTMNFGQQLQQNAANNRLQLAQAQPGSYGFGQNLAQQRIAQAPITTTGTGMTQQPFGQTFGQVAGGFGSMAGGINAGVNAYTGGGRSPYSGLGGIQGLGLFQNRQQTPAPMNWAGTLSGTDWNT